MSAPFLRFLLVSVLGLGVDLALAWGLAALAGLPLPAAAAAGFLAGALLNYLLHEFWTFRDARAPARLSARRGGLYALTLAATLGMRVAAVALLDRLLPGAGGLRDITVLAAATGLSFLVNYGLSRHVVFRTPSPEPE